MTKGGVLALEQAQSRRVQSIIRSVLNAAIKKKELPDVEIVHRIATHR